MKRIRNLLCYFSKFEKLLWCSSVCFIVVAFVLFDRANYLTLFASLIGTTTLIFNAKGNPFGQLLMIIFSVLYAVISYGFAYYGEMITYLGMTAPMALFALVSWLMNPYNGKKSEVSIKRISLLEIAFMFIVTAVVTFIFYFILKNFNTSNLLLSTVSITTSFIAAHLTFRRNPYFALAYAANDIVLIFMWILAAETDSSYFSVIVCFIMFLVNDLYGFFNWLRIQRSQENNVIDNDGADF